MTDGTLHLHDLLEQLHQLKGSDLHLSPLSPPQVRVHGSLVPLEGYPPLDAAETRDLAYSVLLDPQKERLAEAHQLDFAFEVSDLSRFRGNIFESREGLSAVFRAIPYEPVPFDQLGLPRVVDELTDRLHGLVLVTGPTGSGKSTTLAAMIDKINREQYGHILTIEDPIEFIHPHKNCIVNQREVYSHVESFEAALKVALREDPDYVLIGELRDLETIESALRIAETGHLTFATLHTNSAASTIIRIVDVFPAAQQPQIRTQLSQVLEGVLSQQLLPKANGQGRSMALEILLPTPAVRNLIRTDKVHLIYSQMTTGQEEHAMQTLNQSLARLYHEREITLETARNFSPNIDELQELIEIGSRSRSQSSPVSNQRPGLLKRGS